MNLVMDSSALLALLRDENGADVVDALLWDAGNHNVVHAINLCEVYYNLVREFGEPQAESYLNLLGTLGLTIREDMDPDLWREAGRYKAKMKRISLADCFCMALANRTSAELVTADHHELDEVAASGLCKVRFIR